MISGGAAPCGTVTRSSISVGCRGRWSVLPRRSLRALYRRHRAPQIASSGEKRNVGAAVQRDDRQHRRNERALIQRGRAPPRCRSVHGGRTSIQGNRNRGIHFSVFCAAANVPVGRLTMPLDACHTRAASSRAARRRLIDAWLSARAHSVHKGLHSAAKARLGRRSFSYANSAAGPFFCGDAQARPGVIERNVLVLLKKAHLRTRSVETRLAVT